MKEITVKTLFLNPEHKEKLKTMIKADKTYIGDLEQLSLFYIISGNFDLYNKRKFIYNPKEHVINLDFEESSVDFSSSIKSLIKLGYNLYNGWSDNYTTPMDILCTLDEDNLILANNAMNIRFNRRIQKRIQSKIQI